nr:reverse transcriptase domain-containing protein [Tanacetum cinerariifolium]
MAATDEEKTAFHTGQGVYYYTKMPFGLKNAGATYQRLMDKAFENQMGRNIEVYVDDLVIKSHTETEMVRDVAETFQTLRKINMKLNLKKCSFGLAEGVFLGYVITPEGIKPCPNKPAAVLQLLSPQTIKEVQSLNEKLASLNRPRTLIKGQILADFLNEIPSNASQGLQAAARPDGRAAAFADVVSAGIGKGMSEGLKHGVEHGHAQRTIESLEAYDPEAEAKFAAALQSLKDLKLPLLDQLEGLKDAPMDVIMASLYLEDDSRGDAPQFIRDLCPSSSQLAIPVYPEVRDPKNPWACKEEIKLVDAIAVNISHAEQKKRSRIVCRTHGVGSAHHARSDRVPVSTPIVVPQGLALLLVDAATQTDPDDA